MTAIAVGPPAPSIEDALARRYAELELERAELKPKFAALEEIQLRWQDTWREQERIRNAYMTYTGATFDQAKRILEAASQ